MQGLLGALIITSVVALGAAGPSATRCCTLHKLSIDPRNPANADTFVGIGHTLQVEFKNESDRDPVRVFPESPLTIRHLTTSKSCEIEGGVWVRDSVFLSEDEKTLVVLEFSGESNHLIAYDTTNCKKRGDIDVSGARWSVNKNEILVGTSCKTRNVDSCEKRRVFAVSKFCGPTSGGGYER